MNVTVSGAVRMGSAASHPDPARAGPPPQWAYPGCSLNAPIGLTKDTRGRFPLATLARNCVSSSRWPDAAFGLLLPLHPDIKTESGHLVYTLNYAVFAADDQPLLKGTESVAVEGIDLDRATLRATQQAMSALIAGMRPDESKFPPVLSLKSRSLEFAANKDKPWASGTGFYFNSSGQVLTAAHVIQDCVRIDVKRDEQVRPTRGNVSARGGLTGSVGQFQFSAPIQPGSSGGPVVSDGGELLGITVGTLNALALAKQGVIPQNVNFALEARYAARFLEKNNLAFTTVEPDVHGDAHTANQAALAAVVSVECYE